MAVALVGRGTEQAELTSTWQAARGGQLAAHGIQCRLPVEVSCQLRVGPVGGGEAVPQRLGRAEQARRQDSSSGSSSLWITMTSTGRPVMCRAANRSAACDWRSAQCASSRTRIVSPAARTSSRKLCPT